MVPGLRSNVTCLSGCVVLHASHSVPGCNTLVLGAITLHMPSTCNRDE